jgi:hypothetical protein
VNIVITVFGRGFFARRKEGGRRVKGTLFTSCSADL